MITRNSTKILFTIIFLAIITLPFSLYAKKKLVSRTFFNTENRTIAVYELINSDKISAETICKECDSISLSLSINRELKQINKNLISEFRRCEKFGIYRVVDTTLPRDLSVRFSLDKPSIKSDTLLIPFSVTTTETATKRKIVKDFNHSVIIPDYSVSSDINKLYSMVRAIADYRKKFPIEQVVKDFYPKR